MKTGQCVLCGTEGKLHNSHFLPRSAYRLMRESANESPVLMSRQKTILSDRQMTHPVLCGARESRFSANGESYVVRWLKKGNRFPLLDRLKLAIPLYTTGTNAAFVCQSVGIDGEKIGYFGLSILWRAAVRSWRTFDGGSTSVALEPRHMEEVRKYLAGEAAFPGDRIAVVATVKTDLFSQGSCFVPSRVTDHSRIVYSLLARGLSFRFVFGGAHSPAQRAISCIGPGENLIFANDGSDEALASWSSLMETSAPKGSLAPPLG